MAEAEARVTIQVEAAETPELHEIRIAGPDSARVGEMVSHTAEVVDQFGLPVDTAGVVWEVVPGGVAITIAESDPRAITVQPAEAGEYTLIAREQELAQPSPDADPNQWPPEGGYQQLIPELSGNSFPAGWLLVDDTQNGRSTLTIQPGNPVTGGGVIRATYGRGYRGGGHTAHLVSPRFRPVRELVVDEVLRVKDGFVPHPSGINKTWFINNFGVPGQTISANVGVLFGGRLRPSWVGQGSSVVDRRLTSDAEVVRGEWVHLRWHIVMDGEAGMYAVWAAPYGAELREVGRWEDLPTAAPGWDLLLDQVQIRPIWGGTGGEVQEEQYIEWARYRVAGR